VTRIHEDRLDIETPEGPVTLKNDVVLALTGYHPDYGFLKSFGVTIAEDAVETPVFDPDTHETLRKGVFIAGTVCGGRHTSRWFIENGRHHAALIASKLADRFHADVPA
jgi:thioredoxin reductase (NADPH)